MPVDDDEDCEDCEYLQPKLKCKARRQSLSPLSFQRIHKVSFTYTFNVMIHNRLTQEEYLLGLFQSLATNIKLNLEQSIQALKLCHYKQINYKHCISTLDTFSSYNSSRYGDTYYILNPRIPKDMSESIKKKLKEIEAKKDSYTEQEYNRLIIKYTQMLMLYERMVDPQTKVNPGQKPSEIPSIIVVVPKKMTGQSGKEEKKEGVGKKLLQETRQEIWAIDQNDSPRFITEDEYIKRKSVVIDQNNKIQRILTTEEIQSLRQHYRTAKGSTEMKEHSQKTSGKIAGQKMKSRL